MQLDSRDAMFTAKMKPWSSSAIAYRFALVRLVFPDERFDLRGYEAADRRCAPSS